MVVPVDLVKWINKEPEVYLAWFTAKQLHRSFRSKLYVVDLLVSLLRGHLDRLSSFFWLNAIDNAASNLGRAKVGSHVKATRVGWFIDLANQFSQILSKRFRVTPVSHANDFAIGIDDEF